MENAGAPCTLPARRRSNGKPTLYTMRLEWGAATCLPLRFVALNSVALTRFQADSEGVRETPAPRSGNLARSLGDVKPF